MVIADPVAAGFATLLILIGACVLVGLVIVGIFAIVGWFVGEGK